MALNLWRPEPKRRAGIVRMPPVVPGVPLSKYTNRELGVRIARQSHRPRQDPGIAWARLMNASNRPEKDAAREAVLAMCTTERFPRLKMLTFPASEWRFERALLAQRGEPADRGTSERTALVGLERDVAVYRAACHSIPRPPRNGRRGRVRNIEVPEFASAGVQTAHVGHFYCCAFEDYAHAGEQFGVGAFDAAWLDFNGQLTDRRLDAIERFWNRQLRSLLIVTLLPAHMTEWMWARIKARGGIDRLLADRLAGSEVEDVRSYGDGAPMLQIALRRTSGEPILRPNTNREG